MSREGRVSHAKRQGDAPCLCEDIKCAGLPAKVCLTVYSVFCGMQRHKAAHGQIEYYRNTLQGQHGLQGVLRK